MHKTHSTDETKRPIRPCDRLIGVAVNVCVVSITLALGAANAIEDKQGIETPILPPNAYLVKARAQRVDEAMGYAADFVIEHVYAGPDALKGQEFTLADYMLRNGSQINPKLIPPRVKGEVGLWWVGYETVSSGAKQDERGLFSYHDLGHKLPFIYYPFPAVLKGGWPPDPLYPPQRFGDLKLDPYDFGSERMLQWAEGIEKVYKASGDDDRIALLKKYVASDDPPLAAWAVSTLSRFLEPDAKRQLFTSKGKVRKDCELLFRDPSINTHVRKDVKSMLEEFADDPKLTVYAQTELDEVLARIEGDDWLKSDRRQKMLQRWKDIKDPIERFFIDGRLHDQDASR